MLASPGESIHFRKGSRLCEKDLPEPDYEPMSGPADLKDDYHSDQQINVKQKTLELPQRDYKCTSEHQIQSGLSEFKHKDDAAQKIFQILEESNKSVTTECFVPKKHNRSKRKSKNHKRGGRTSLHIKKHSAEPTFLSLRSDPFAHQHNRAKGGRKSATKIFSIQEESNTPESPVSSGIPNKRKGSKEQPINFKKGSSHGKQNFPSQEECDRPESPLSSFTSNKYNRSKRNPINFKKGGSQGQQKNWPEPDNMDTMRNSFANQPIGSKRGGSLKHSREKPFVPMKRTSVSMRRPKEYEDKLQKFREMKSSTAERTFASVYSPEVDSTLTMLKHDINTFVKDELARFKKLTFSKNLGNYDNGEQLIDEDEQKPKKEFLKLSNFFLRKRKEVDLANFLEKEILAEICQQKLMSNFKTQLLCLHEWISDSTSSNIEVKGGGNPQDKQTTGPTRLPEDSELATNFADFFKPIQGRKRSNRVLVTKGMSGIGKTVLTQKFTLDWAEGNNPNIHFFFPVTFRELNLLNVKKTFSLVELIHYLFNETKEAGIRNFEDFQVLFILDGLDECRPPLDFNNTQILTDVTESGSVHTLLINLIRGDLLPSARLWITTRPAAANQIPAECVDMVTEVRGFTDQQKEEYFRKRFSDEDRTRAIVSHIEGSRSLHMMCYIPIFCWITATVLDYDVEQKEKVELPRTLTEMYIHFLLVQVKQNSMKYQKNTETTPISKPETEKCLLALGKLAFEQLEKGNLIFTERYMEEYDLCTEASTIFSGLFTEVSQHKVGLNQKRVFGFVHQSFQEFLAALYVSVMFTQRGINLLGAKHFSLSKTSKHMQFYKTAVDSALQSSNGHMDMFVRFLLGLSLETNQNLLRRLIKTSKAHPKVKEALGEYIKKKIKDSPSVEKSIHLFYWLNELNDHSLQQEIQQYLSSENVSDKKLTLSQWSTLAFILLSSQKDLNVFDLKKFCSSKEALLRLLPVVKASQKSLLSSCGLSWKSCIHLLPALTSDNSSLRELDLSDNDLRDTGAQTLSGGLKNPHCRLEVLRLSGCLIAEEGCSSLRSALNSNPSHLRELDLSFNHPGETEKNLLLEGLENPNWRLETLNLDHCGEKRLQPSPGRYFLNPSLDKNTAHRNLRLTLDKKKVTLVPKEEQAYPDFRDRFDTMQQILCSDGLNGRSYWEVRWTGSVRIGVAYSEIRRKGNSDECCLGRNDQSWSLFCSHQGFSAWHDNKETKLETFSDTDSNRVAVYLDWSAGTVSFYLLQQDISSVRIHLHTFQSAFTDPLYPAFGFRQHRDTDNPTCSIYLTSFDE